MKTDKAVLALPSKGSLNQPTLDFLARCGLRVSGGGRRYTGALDGMPGLTLLFCRAEEIPRRLAEGTADLGITGLDLYSEDQEHAAGLQCLIHDLGYGQARLVAAVPQSWIDVSSVDDLVDLAPEFLSQHGRALIVGTSFPSLTRKFFGERGLVAYALIRGMGALEALPASGGADLIVDLTSSGTTLAQNGLKELSDGVVLQSQACLICRSKSLERKAGRLTIERLSNRIKATLEAASSAQVRALIKGSAARLVPHLNGLAATLSWQAKQGQSTAVLIDCPRCNLEPVVELLRAAGAERIVVSRPEFVF